MPTPPSASSPKDGSLLPHSRSGGDPSWLQLSELYRSIQGESRFAGEACIFVRTTGCNLRCIWCDSSYTFKGGERVALTTLLERIETLGPGLVELTGGEPLLQAGVYPLMESLLSAGRTVLLETSGSLSLAKVPAGVHKIVDLKAPSSGEVAHNLLSNLELLGPGDELKIVIADETDYRWACAMIQTHALAERCGALLLSPLSDGLPAVTLVEWMLRDRLPARLNLQLHKFIWPEAKRGV